MFQSSPWRNGDWICLHGFFIVCNGLVILAIQAAKKDQKASRLSALADYYKDQAMDFKKAETYSLKALAIETDLITELAAAQTFVHLTKKGKSFFCLSKADVEPSKPHKPGRPEGIIFEIIFLRPVNSHDISITIALKRTQKL